MNDNSIHLSNQTLSEICACKKNESKPRKYQCDFVPMKHQVAGHKIKRNTKQPAFLLTKCGKLLKVIQSYERGIREHQFYKFINEYVAKNKEEKYLIKKLKTFVPGYYGTERIQNYTYIKLENLFTNIEEPNILDLKIGPLLVDPKANIYKIKRSRYKCDYLAYTGFQLIGMQMYANDNVVKLDSKTGRALSLTKVNQVLSQFFSIHHQQKISINKFILSSVLSKLLDLYAWFSEQNFFSFVSASILIIFSSKQISTITENFNGKASNGYTSHQISTYSNHQKNVSYILENFENQSVHKSSTVYLNPKYFESLSNIAQYYIQSFVQTPIVHVKLIDFAHAYHTNNLDINSIIGIKGFINSLVSILLDINC
ncbi:hypothetical protein A3Q56_02313 [Intoshia linei]|uniref:Kinase n=1 Tax=Intoshia linei TaxID=1819745 RepID=A0A177B774_9BILA|nr:hypothetical protein A3Q56_02313 [Intoshia linei]